MSSTTTLAIWKFEPACARSRVGKWIFETKKNGLTFFYQWNPEEEGEKKTERDRQAMDLRAARNVRRRRKVPKISIKTFFFLSLSLSKGVKLPSTPRSRTSPACSGSSSLGHEEAEAAAASCRSIGSSTYTSSQLARPVWSIERCGQEEMQEQLSRLSLVRLPPNSCLHTLPAGNDSECRRPVDLANLCLSPPEI